MSTRLKRVALHTLGCKLNFAETDTLARRFEEAGYETAPLDEIPDRRAHGLKIDWDIADSITKANLLDALDCARKEVTNYINSPVSSRSQDKDFQYNTEVLIPSLKNVLIYYGVDL